MPLHKIISGGQTGADRAALDWARTHGIPHGGWCPRGRLAEDGVIARKYRLRQTPFADYAQRTEWNVRDSDGTVIFSLRRRLTGGSLMTAEFARQHRKPLLHLSQRGARNSFRSIPLGARNLFRSTRPGAQDPANALRDFVRRHRIRILNIAGPRQSNEPKIGCFVWRVLDQAFGAALSNAASRRDPDRVD